jgi:hypothetical protein
MQYQLILLEERKRPRALILNPFPPRDAYLPDFVGAHRSPIDPPFSRQRRSLHSDELV